MTIRDDEMEYAQPPCKLRYEIKIISMTATYRMGVDLDLNKLASHMEGVEYYPESMASCAFLRNGRLKKKMAIWKNGILNATGRNRQDLKEAMDHTAKMIEECINK